MLFNVLTLSRVCLNGPTEITAVSAAAKSSRRAVRSVRFAKEDEKMSKEAEMMKNLDELLRIKISRTKDCEKKDLVEVVRCRDCIYNLNGPYYEAAKCSVFYSGSFLQNDFCSHGKRR